ncbi:site-specific integrase [Brevibacillus fortis]|nr:site-specific integrase [Brevibacillus fortis]
MPSSREKRKLELIHDEIKMDVASDSNYSPSDSIIIAKEILDEYRMNEINPLIKGKFEDDEWTFSCHLKIGHVIRISFHKIKFDSYPNIMFSKDYLQLIIKCWCTEQLSKMQPHSVKTCIEVYLAEIVSLTYSFSNIGHYLTFLEGSDYSIDSKYLRLNTLLNFLDYIDLIIDEKLIKDILSFRKSLLHNRKKNVRQLPTAEEIFLFSWSIEDFYKEILHEENIEILKLQFYPIYIWWILTNIIPMRPSEFCSLEREHIYQKDNRYFIRLPRLKKPKYRSDYFQIITEAEMNKDTFDIIQKYIRETEKKFGATKYLLSYPCSILTYPENRYNRKINSNYVNTCNFHDLIGRFYRDVVNKIYGIKLEGNQQLTGNDTRHLAFTALMLQGYSRPEIARLGGHYSLTAQMHYQMHPDYYFAVSIKKLKDQFQLRTINPQLFGDHDVLYNKVVTDVLARETASMAGKLSIGYCTDPLVRCESPTHIFCKHWRIDPEELKHKETKDLLMRMILERRNHINELADFLFHLNEKLIFPNESELNEEILLRRTKAKELDDSLHQISKLELVLKGDLL